MAYQRVDYWSLDGKQSAAYYDADTESAWDVFTREPVTVVQDPVTHQWSQWTPPKSATAHVAPQQERKARESNRPMPVTIKPNFSPWAIIPVSLFGLAMIWFEWTFAK